MAVDVSVYNEIARNNDALTKCVSNAYTPCYASGLADGCSAATTINNGGFACQQTIYPLRLACDLIAQPWCCCYWAAIPTLPSVTGGLFVCDAGTGYGNICCAWTVPGGAQFLRFQMWGAGAASMAMCCCGISIHGGSGAYASVILPAVPGCVYTLCAGCALNSYPSSITGAGCSSFVNGYGLNNVCADGGEHHPYCWMRREKAVNGVDNPSFNTCYMLPNSTWACNVVAKSAFVSGNYLMCSNGGFCTGSSCSHIGTHPFVTSCKTFYGNVTNATQCCHFVIGTPGAWASMISAGSYNFYAYSPPVTCINCACCSNAYVGPLGADYGCGPGVVYSYPCQRPDYAPGKGGLPNMDNAGCFRCGFPGTGGAVCVQYL